MDIKTEIQRLQDDLQKFNQQSAEYAFKAKATEAKLRKLQKQLDKINSILNEQLPAAV